MPVQIPNQGLILIKPIVAIHAQLYDLDRWQAQGGKVGDKVIQVDSVVNYLLRAQVLANVQFSVSVELYIVS